MSGYTGGSGPEDVARLRRMTAEPTMAVYTDDMLIAEIERHPCPDEWGVWPDEVNWTATFDLAASASVVWEEKAGLYAANFDFTADGAQFSKAQQYEQALKQARRWRSLRQSGVYEVLPVTPANGGEDAFAAQQDGALDFSSPAQSGLLALIE